MKITSIITMVLLILTLGPTISSCTTPRPSDPPPIEIEPTPGKPGPNEPFSVAHNGKIRILFNSTYFPPEYALVEIIFAGGYHGYFNMKDIIYLPRIQGRNKLTAIFSDVNGKRIGDVRNYYIEVDQ